MSDSPALGAGFAAGVAAGLIGDMTAAAFTVVFTGFARFAAFFPEPFVRFRADFLAAAGLADIMAISVLIIELDL